MLTDQDISRMKKVFVTKEDAKAFVTKRDLTTFAKKKDLKGFATKQDLRRFASKQDLKRFATKQDLENTEIRIMSRILPRLDSLEDRFDVLDHRFSDLITTVEKFLAPIDGLRLEAAVSAAQYCRQIEWNHKVAKKVNVPFDY